MNVNFLHCSKFLAKYLYITFFFYCLVSNPPNTWTVGICFLGKLRKYILSAVSGPSSINVVFGLVCLVEIISLSNAQNKIKCFNENKNRMKALGGVMLDCSNMIDKRQPKVIEEWVQTQVSNPEGSSKHILSIGLENDNFDNLFVFPEMKSLKKLSLKNNNISSIEKNALSKLLVLEELDLSHNSINSKYLHNCLFIKYISTT